MERSRHVSGDIGAKLYNIYGDSLVDGVRNLLPNIPGQFIMSKGLNRGGEPSYCESWIQVQSSVPLYEPLIMSFPNKIIF